MRAVVVLASLALAWSARGDSIMIDPCDEITVFSPFDGASAVAVDAGIVTSWLRDDPVATCGLALADDRGERVALEWSQDENTGSSVLRPVRALESDRGYELSWNESGMPERAWSREPTCGAPKRVRFRTAPAPAVVLVEWSLYGHEDWYGAWTTKLGRVMLRFSEPVADPADLSPEAGFVKIDVEAPPGAPSMETTPNEARDGLVRSYRIDSGPGATEVLPDADVRVRVRVEAGLRFASGATLAEAFEHGFVPNDLPLGWTPFQDRVQCEPSFGGGCTHAGASLAALIPVVALGLRRRRLSA